MQGFWRAFGAHSRAAVTGFAFASGQSWVSADNDGVSISPEACSTREHPLAAAMAAAGGLSALARFKRPRRAVSAAPAGRPATQASTSLDAFDCEPPAAAPTDTDDDLADWLALADASKDALTLSQFWIDEMRLVASADRGKRVVTVTAIRVAVLSQV